MKIDSGMMGGALDGVAGRIRELEEQGYDACITAEMASDPFLPLVLAAEHSERIELMTSIAVAFARNPMTLANLGHDLNAYSKGRFILGLGSQIKPHIERRFSMPWSKPASRMRELIQAMRAIWNAWYTGERLDFRGEFYQHTLMTPMFTPTNTEYGAPRVFLAAVGPVMTEVAGEVADGMIAHGFTTERYLREVTAPALARGLEKAGRERATFEITYPAFVVTGDDENAAAQMRTGVSRQLAFYGSTPAYRPVLELHGWGELQTELHALSKQGEWSKMGTLIDADVLDAFAVVAPPNEVAGALRKRFGGLVQRIICTAPFASPTDRAAFMEELRAA